MSVIIRILKRFYDENKLFFVISALFLIVGIILGALYYTNLSVQSKDEVFKYFESIKSVSEPDYVSGYKVILKRYIFYSVFMWLCGLTVIGSVLSIIPVITHGFSMSYCISALYNIYGLKGIVTAFTSFIPGFVIMIPVMVIFCVYTMRRSLKTLLLIKGRGILHYTVICMLLSAILLVSTLFDFFVSSYVMVNMF